MLALTPEQLDVVDAIKAWRQRGGRRMTVGGLAGTGKTTIAEQLPALLDLRPAEVAFCAPTGKAAYRLSEKTGLAATTIHSLMYAPCQRHDPSCPQVDDEEQACSTHVCPPVTFQRKGHLSHLLKLIVCDEASMVDEWLYEDLTTYSVPVLWIGDHGQLPPVRGRFSLMERPDARLETIVRQAAGSPILQLAMQAREHGSVEVGDYGPGVRKLARGDIGDVDFSNALALCGTNRLRCQMNRAIRGIDRTGPPGRGDRVICLRNDREHGVFNGQMGTVVDLVGDVMEVALDDRDQPYRHRVWLEQFGEEARLHGAPRHVGLWDFGYCLTVHKSQGSEADRVVLLEDWRSSDKARWLYTGITRAKRELTILEM